jgi:hypothetical protein
VTIKCALDGRSRTELAALADELAG